MRRLVLATNNKGKVKEFQKLLSEHGFEVIALSQLPEIPEVEETGHTFKENAELKAVTIAKATGDFTLADDSGLEVDYLNGEPGVYSARFAGPEKNDQANIDKLLRLLEGVPWEARGARFKAVIALANPKGETQSVEGICEGKIAQEPSGNGGFGYDPIFYLPEFHQTFAELNLEIKNQISHRGKAIAKIKDVLAGLGES